MDKNPEQVVEYLSAHKEAKNMDIISIFNAISKECDWRNISVTRRDAIMLSIRNLIASPLLLAAMNDTVIKEEEILT